jgi:hypothetical protein
VYMCLHAFSQGIADISYNKVQIINKGHKSIYMS